jgi:hypothetical protein
MNAAGRAGIGPTRSSVPRAGQMPAFPATPASCLGASGPLAILLGVCTLLIAACGAGQRASRVTPPGTSQTRSAAPPGASAATPPETSSAGAVAVARAFDAQDALQIVTALADPSFQGRHTGTPGEVKGAEYLAAAFQRAGLQPGGDSGGYLQSLPVTVEEMAAVPVLDLTGASGAQTPLRFRADFRPIFGGTAGAGDVQGPGLFVGNGHDLTGLAVKGKILLATVQGSLADLDTRARQDGALGVLVTTGQATLLKGEGRPPDTGALPVVELSQSGAAALLSGSGHTREELNADLQAGKPLPSFPLPWTIHLAVSLVPPAQVQAHNVLGILPGTDSSRTVVVGAHFEEIGPDPDGTVYPAANDNASGTAVLLELARLLQNRRVRPRATIVFAAWSGHEEGLFGSQFSIDHPRFPLAQTSLYLNLDTVGQGAGTQLDAFAASAGAQGLVHTAQGMLQASGEAAPVRVSSNADGTSDDLSFSQAGVPALALNWNGIIEDGRLHTPADTATTVDPAKLRLTGQIAALVLQLAAR